MKRAVFICGTLALALPSARLVSASPPAAGTADDGAARIFYEMGQRYYDLGRYGDALKQFDAAYRRSGRAALLYNMARCHEQLGDRAQAVRAYRQFLAAEPGVEDRSELEAHVQTLLPLEPPAAAPPAAKQKVLPPPRKLRRYSFIIGGVGLGVLLTSIGTGVSALRLEQKLDAGCPLGLCPASYPDAADDRSRGRQLALSTDVLLGVGGALTAAGLVGLIVEIVRSRSHPP